MRHPKHDNGNSRGPVCDFLRRPAAYPEAPKKVELRETHISWVFLTDTRAYKIKKPVKFEFADFSTVELRRRACENELRLNRRLAPDVYLDLQPITRDSDGCLAIGGLGEVVDWAVRMRRLPDDQCLAAKLADGSLSAQEVQRFASKLARFYEDAPPISIRCDAYRRAIERHVRANRKALLEFCEPGVSDTVKRTHASQLLYLHTYAEAFDERVCDGRIVEGHGDLRPEHVYLTPDPVVIDCIEFSPELRTLDVLDEISFFQMECAYAHTGWVGDRLLSSYFAASGDRPAPGLQAFYAGYRACVRAKVNFLRATQAAPEADARAARCANDYLRLAGKVLRQLGPPAVLVMRGPSGVGKTTLAGVVADTLGFDHLQSDKIRGQLFKTRERHGRFGEGIYSSGNHRRVYDAMLGQAHNLVSRGLSVVLDGTFLTNELQALVARLAQETRARVMFVNCGCQLETAAERIQRRDETKNSLSDADFAIHRRQLEEQQLPPAEMPQCSVDTDWGVPLMLRTILDAFKSQTALPA